MSTDLPLHEVLHLGLLLALLALRPLSYYIVYLILTFGIIAFSTVVLHQHVLLLEGKTANNNTTRLTWVWETTQIADSSGMHVS